MVAKLGEGLRKPHSLLTQGSPLLTDVGRRRVGPTQGEGLGAGRLIVPLGDTTIRRYWPGDLRSFHTRASVAWEFDTEGVLREYAVNVLRLTTGTFGLLAAVREMQSTNRCTNHNANPNGSLTNMSLVNATNGLTTLTEVNDAAAVATAKLHLVCTSGMVFCLDNTLGDTIAHAAVSGAAQNGLVVTLSAYVRGGTGALNLITGSLSGIHGGSTAFTASADYVRCRHGTTPSQASTMFGIRADVGQKVWFILNQLEDAAISTSRPSSPIVVAGSQVTRARDEIAIPIEVAEGQPFYQYVDFVRNNSNANGATTRILGADEATVKGLGLSSTNTGSVSDGTTALTTSNTSTVATRNRMACAANTAGRSLCLDGGTVVSDAVAQYAATRILLGQRARSSDTNSGNFHFHEVRLGRVRPSADVVRLGTMS